MAKTKEAGQNTLNVIAGLMGKPSTKEEFEAEVQRRKEEKMAKQSRVAASGKKQENGTEQVIPTHIRKGEVMNDETIDARISKLSLEDLQSKLEEAQRQVRVYQAAIEEKKSEEISQHLEKLKALGWQPPTASGRTASSTGSTGKKRQMSEETKAKMRAAQQARWAKTKAK